MTQLQWESELSFRLDFRFRLKYHVIPNKTMRFILVFPISMRRNEILSCIPITRKSEQRSAIAFY